MINLEINQFAFCQFKGFCEILGDLLISFVTAALTYFVSRLIIKYKEKHWHIKKLNGWYEAILEGDFYYLELKAEGTHLNLVGYRCSEETKGHSQIWYAAIRGKLNIDPSLTDRERLLFGVGFYTDRIKGEMTTGSLQIIEISESAESRKLSVQATFFVRGKFETNNIIWQSIENPNIRIETES